jgi:predicted DsbA family dithiol-disulfide isomerase
MNNIRIDLVSDVVCPWCIIGYKRLERALESVSDQLTAEIQWHPFELNPHMPEGGQNLRDHVIEKYGVTAEQSTETREMLTSLGKELGFDFRFSDDSRMYNTHKAHQLLMWAESFDKKHQLKMALFSANFTDGKNIDDNSVLVTLAEQVGLNGAEALEVIQSKDWSEKVDLAELSWTSAGIQAVPAYVINRKHLISGAQEPEVLAQALLQIAEEDAE